MRDEEQWPEDDVDLSETEDAVSCSSCGASGAVGTYVEHEPDCARAKYADEIISEIAAELEPLNESNLRRKRRRSKGPALVLPAPTEEGFMVRSDRSGRWWAELQPMKPGQRVEGRTAKEAVAALEQREGRKLGPWSYLDRQAVETGQQQEIPMWVETGGDEPEYTWESDVPGVEEMKPNRPGLLRKPAMDTKFGAELDETELDEVRGADGEDLDRAMSRYETFHAKQPIRVAELDHDIPTKWVCTGDGLSVMYKTDKWHKDGDDEEYKHLHGHSEKRPYALGKGVRVFEPASEIKRSRVGGKPVRVSGGGQRLPVAIPKALTLLGYCMGLFVRHTHDGEVYEVNPRGSYLFCSPKGDLLLVYSPQKQADGSSGFLCAMAGGSLRVLKDGIDG